MKILYDYQIFQAQKFGGISRYFSELLGSIDKYKMCDFEISLKYSQNYYIRQKSFFNEKIGDLKKYVTFLPGFEFRGKGRIYKFLRNIGIINYQYGINENSTINKLKKGDFDIFHPTYYRNYFLDFIGRKPFVLTVHDLIPEFYPDNEGIELLFLERKKELIIKAAKIIAVSNNTKQDIIKFYGAEESKIHVIYHGSNLSKIKDIKIFTRDFLDKIPQKYLFFVGNRSGYKNFDFFVKSVSKLLIEDKNLNLVCSGGQNFNAVEMELLNKLNIIDQVVYFEADDEKLSYLYSNALAVVLPSLYEGFGIPILEAFSCDCPVILSNSSSFPEVAADAGVYFEPGHSESLLVAIQKVIYDKKFRNELIFKGQNRAKNFSWDKTANQTVDIYKNLVK